MNQDIPHYKPASPPRAEGVQEPPKRGMSARQKIAVAVLDVVMIGELAVAMAWANKTPEVFTPVFLRVFFAMLLPTLALGYLAIRRLGRVSGQARP